MENYVAKVMASPLNGTDLSSLPAQKPAAINLKHAQTEKSFASHLDDAGKAEAVNQSAMDISATDARSAREAATKQIAEAMKSGDNEALKRAQASYDDATKQIRAAVEREYLAMTTHIETNDDIPAAVLKALAVHSDDKAEPAKLLSDKSESAKSSPAKLSSHNSVEAAAASKVDCDPKKAGALGCFQGSTDAVMKSGVLGKQENHPALHATAPLSTPFEPSTITIRSTVQPFSEGNGILFFGRGEVPIAVNPLVSSPVDPLQTSPTISHPTNQPPVSLAPQHNDQPAQVGPQLSNPVAKGQNPGPISFVTPQDHPIAQGPMKVDPPAMKPINNWNPGPIAGPFTPRPQPISITPPLQGPSNLGQGSFPVTQTMHIGPSANGSDSITNQGTSSRPVSDIMNKGGQNAGSPQPVSSSQPPVNNGPAPSAPVFVGGGFPKVPTPGFNPFNQPIKKL